jgi:hypothetical protein
MRSLIIIILFSVSALKAAPLLKAKIQYSFDPKQKIKLRVTQIPKSYPWIARDADGAVELPSIGSEIVAENIEDISITDDNGKAHTIKSGTRFHAKLLSAKSARSFARNGGVKLSFYQMELADPKHIIRDNSQRDLDELARLKLKDKPYSNTIDLTNHGLSFDSTAQDNPLSITAKTLANAGSYGLAGAIIAPLAIVSSFKIFSLAALSNPYLLGGSSTLGAAIGLAYGIKRQGKNFIIEPGTELEVNLEQAWAIASDLPDLEPSQSNIVYAKNFDLQIMDIKKTKDQLQISLNYKNSSGEELRYLSFKLVDSMGKEYYPSSDSIDVHFGALPEQSSLNLFFSPEFPSTAHQLKILRLYDQKPLAVANILLK